MVSNKLDMDVYVDGKFIPKVDAINIIEQYGLFESLIFTNGKIFKLKGHLDRLYEGAKVIQLNIPLNRTELLEAIYETIERNNLTEAYEGEKTEGQIFKKSF